MVDFFTNMNLATSQFSVQICYSHIGGIEKVAFDLADLYHLLSIENQLAGFEVKERFYEIGSHQGIKETELYLSAN